MATIIQERTNAYVFNVGLSVALFGMLLMAAAEPAFPSGLWGRPFMSNLGSLLFTTGLLALGWEFRLKRAFTDEMYSKAELALEIREAGLQGVTGNVKTGINWTDLIKNAKNIELCLTFGQTWLHTHIEELKAFMERNNTTLTVHLPDPTDPIIQESLRRRFDYTVAQCQDRIDTARKEYCNLHEDFEVYGDAGAVKGEGSKAPPVSEAALPQGRKRRSVPRVRVFIGKQLPPFAAYVFDKSAVVSLYSYRRDRNPLPGIWVKDPGDLYTFVQDELAALRDAHESKAD